MTERVQGNPLKEKLATGDSVLGIWTIINSPIVVEILGSAGLDFQILDMEHGVFDLASLDACVRACEGAGCSPIVRVPGIDTSIQSALDLGAHGIIVPQVDSYEAARRAVGMTKFPPAGTRGYNPFTRAGRYGGEIGSISRKINNTFGLSALIIENLGAMQDLDSILAIPDLDLVYLGVYDMSAALGCMGDMRDSRVVDFVESSIARIRAAGKAAGVMAKTAEEIRYYTDLGANFLVYGVDTHLVHRAIRDGIDLYEKVKP